MKNTELVEKLREKKFTISCAESITGGMFAKYIIDVPGTSAIFERGIVSYSNRAKIEELDVDPKIIEKFGAISKECAAAMAEGLFNKTKSNICISVTGNAGPLPSENKPCGQYFVGLLIDGKCEVYEFHSKEKERNAIREDACREMFELILSKI